MKRFKIMKLRSIPGTSEKPGDLIAGEPDDLVKGVGGAQGFYWITTENEKTIRAKHYHAKQEEMMICLQGLVEAELHSIEACEKKIRLDSSDKVLYIPCNVWHKVTLFKNSKLFVLTKDPHKPGESEAEFPVKCNCGQFKGK